jgi:putative Holliday junction resolvase
MRALGVDIGRRRVGLAISDRSGTLARPLATLTVAGPPEAVRRVAAEAVRLAAEEDGLSTIVVGMPARLNGEPTEETRLALAFIRALTEQVAIPVVACDERLTSREAETRLAESERDWRRRKKKLDAAAAAIILQDYLDRPCQDTHA